MTAGLGHFSSSTSASFVAWDERFERSRRVMKAVDDINRKFGRDTLRFGASRPGCRWETKFLRRSRRYTTCLAEVLRVA